MGAGEPRRRAHRRRRGGTPDARTGHGARRGADRLPSGPIRPRWGYPVRLHGPGDPGSRALPGAARGAPRRPGARRHRPALGRVPDLESLMRKLILTLTVLSIAALAAAGCGKEGEAASGASELVPAGSVFYGEAALKPEGDQKEAIDAILAKFPGGGQAGDKLKKQIYKDVEILTDESSEAGAVLDGYLVLGTEDGVKAAIDTSKGGKKLSDD